MLDHFLYPSIYFWVNFWTFRGCYHVLVMVALYTFIVLYGQRASIKTTHPHSNILLCAYNFFLDLVINHNSPLQSIWLAFLRWKLLYFPLKFTWIMIKVIFFFSRACKGTTYHYIKKKGVKSPKDQSYISKPGRRQLARDALMPCLDA